MKVRVIQGTKQIGGCITEISTATTKIIIDFGENLDNTKQLEIDGLTYGDKKYDAVFITHSHGDHIGSVNEILKDIDIYVEEKTVSIHNIVCDFKKEYGKKVRKENGNIKYFDFGQKIVVGDITVTPFIVDHSAYNASMFLIEAEGKRILHTGDFRMHGRKGKIFIPTLKEIGNIDLLITEGTTLTREDSKYKTEEQLSNEIKKIISKYKQVYIVTSSTNIDRIVTFYKARKNKLFIEDLCLAAVASKLDNIPNSNSYKDTYTYMSKVYRGKKEPYERYRNHIRNVIEEIPFDKEFILSIKASMLNDLLENKDKIKDACLIYSMWEGYINENRRDDKTKNMVDKLESLGVKCYHKHTSGHADIDTLENLNKYTNPSSVIIIHTEDKNESNLKAKKIFGDRLKEIKDNEYFEV